MTDISQLIYCLLEKRISNAEGTDNSETENTLLQLKNLTKLDFGDDIEKWVEWYIQSHPTEHGKAFLCNTLRIYNLNKKYNPSKNE